MNPEQYVLLLRDELARLEVDEKTLGPCDGVFFRLADGGRTCHLANEQADWEGPTDEALRRMAALGAGGRLSDFWGGFR